MAAELSVCTVPAAVRDREGLSSDGKTEAPSRMPEFSLGGGIGLMSEDGELTDDPDAKKAATVTVTQKNTTTIAPDTASVIVGVQTEAESAAEAQKKNQEQSADVTDAVKKLGIEAKNIRTTGYDIFPSYNSSGNDVTGYRVTTSLEISDLSIEQAGTVLSESIKAGANTVDGVRFTSSQYDDQYQAALQQAVSDSRKKAEVIATAAGQKLGHVLSVAEGYQDDSARYNGLSYATAEASLDKAAGAVGLEPGELTITAEVTVVYEMQPQDVTGQDSEAVVENFAPLHLASRET